MLVKATQTGYYGHLRRKAGSVFELKAVKGKLVTLTPEQQFSPKWMRKLNDKQTAQYEAEMAAANDVGEDDIDEGANLAEEIALAAHASAKQATASVAPEKKLTPAQKAAQTKAAKAAAKNVKDEPITDSADA
jgi:hypothetical protein